MGIKKLRILAIEIFKIMNNIDQSYMKNLFISKANTKVHPNDIVVRHHKFTSYS